MFSIWECSSDGDLFGTILCVVQVENITDVAEQLSGYTEIHVFFWTLLNILKKSYAYVLFIFHDAVLSIFFDEPIQICFKFHIKNLIHWKTPSKNTYIKMEKSSLKAKVIGRLLLRIHSLVTNKRAFFGR